MDGQEPEHDAEVGPDSPDTPVVELPVVELSPDTPVVELPVVDLAPDGPVVAEESPSVEIAPLAGLDPRAVALDPDLAKRQASATERAIIDPAAADPSAIASRSAGTPPSIDERESLRPSPAPDTQAAGEETSDQSTIWRRTFPAIPSSVHDARGFAADALPEIPDVTLDEIRLMVSELASNAIEHAPTSFDLTIHRTTEEVRVEVCDHGAGTPAMRSVGPDAVRGRGLEIVAMLSTHWGVQQESDSAKTVWFTVKLSTLFP